MRAIMRDRENGHEREYHRKKWIESSGEQRGALSQEQSAQIGMLICAGRDHDLFQIVTGGGNDEAAEPHQSGSAEQLYHHRLWRLTMLLIIVTGHIDAFGRLGLWLYRCARGCDDG